MKLLSQEEWNCTQSYHEISVPEIGACFFTGGRPTTHPPDGGISTTKYSNITQRYLNGMTQPGAIERLRHELQGYYIQLVSDKNPKHPDCEDYHYIEAMTGK